MKRLLFICLVLIAAFTLQGCTGSNNWAVPGAASNLSPTAVITAPLAGSVSDEGLNVTFTGAGQDTEDGVLTGASLVWASDIDGQIGTGLTFGITTLSRGVHVITLTATDRSGGQGTASITITVRTPWFADTSWGYRQQITISASMAPLDQTDFPALIKITDQTNPLFGRARSDGFDILFTDMDGVTQIDHEIELYRDTGTEELDAWVRIPNLSSISDTILFMYYGNSIAANQENVNSVWDSNFQMVQHLHESPNDGVAGGHVDSTSNAYNFTPYNFQNDIGGSTDAAGKIGNADEFAGDDDYLGSDGFDSVFFEDLYPTWTFSAWIKTSVAGRAIFSEGRYAGSNPWPVALCYVQLTGAGEFHSRGHANDWDSTHSFNSNETGLNDDTWRHVVMASNNGDMDIYIDGVFDRNYVFTPEGNISISFSTIGAFRRYWSDTWMIGGYWEGFIDEVRASNVKRSAEWISASFLNQNDPGTGNPLDPDVYTTFLTEENY